MAADQYAAADKNFHRKTAARFYSWTWPRRAERRRAGEKKRERKEKGTRTEETLNGRSERNDDGNVHFFLLALLDLVPFAELSTFMNTYTYA